MGGMAERAGLSVEKQTIGSMESIIKPVSVDVLKRELTDDKILRKTNAHAP